MVNALHIGESPLAPQGSGRQKRPSYAILHGTQLKRLINATPQTHEMPELTKIWRPRPESNRGTRICSPLRNHSATRPRVGECRTDTDTPRTRSISLTSKREYKSTCCLFLTFQAQSAGKRGRFLLRPGSGLMYRLRLGDPR